MISESRPRGSRGSMVLPTVIAVALASAAVHAAPADRWLRVRGPHVVGADGVPLRLVGVGLSPVHEEWRVGGFKSLREVVAYYRRLGCNSMRIAFYRSHTFDQKIDLIRKLGPERFVAEEIDPQVREVTSQGLYAILDWHLFADDWGLPGLTPAQRIAYLYDPVIPLWRAIAQRYRDEPLVAIFELWNEPRWPGFPLGDPRAAPEVRRWYQAVIAAIRAVDQRHIILVSDHNAGWGTAKPAMWTRPDGKLHVVDSVSPPQLVYSHHAAALSELRGQNAAADAFSRHHQVPVAYGEVELQPDLEENRYLGPLQRRLLARLVARQVANGLFQVWQGWRSGMKEWQDVWVPLVGAGRAAPARK